jgi:N-acetylmuramic acid 6-phosphate etherase
MSLITEQESHYDDLEKKSVSELLLGIHEQDKTVAEAVGKAIPSITAFVEALVPRMELGGRLFYIGAGTSGRLGILDASECPPTFGVSHDLVIGLIAGGDGAIRKAVEFAEDDPEGAWQDMKVYSPTVIDTVVGIAASGRTPYVIGGLQAAKKAGLLTACVTCNPATALAAIADFPIEVITGPEFVTGSTRMKAGTAQKMVLNMISTGAMIRLGRVKGNKMVDMMLSNHKLQARAKAMLMQLLQIDAERAEELLFQHGNVRKALESQG